MGTSTIFRRHNDLACTLAGMSKKELESIDGLNPWKDEKESVRGWSILMELHNGNFHPLIWWYGRLLYLGDAPKLLTKKHYNYYTGKYSRSSEWTLLKNYLQQELARLDKIYKRYRMKEIRERRRNIELQKK
ncbi:MAG: hypothetical protein ABIH99_05330 [Candidatus Micrarchaeota archaeon]